MNQDSLTRSPNVRGDGASPWRDLAAVLSATPIDPEGTGAVGCRGRGWGSPEPPAMADDPYR